MFALLPVELQILSDKTCDNLMVVNYHLDLQIW